jgi:hypothetical protein
VQDISASICGMCSTGTIPASMRGMDNDGRGIPPEAGITGQRIEQHCGWLANAPDVTELRRL